MGKSPGKILSTRHWAKEEKGKKKRKDYSVVWFFMESRESWLKKTSTSSSCINTIKTTILAYGA